jgi:hypothetical protein
MIGALQYSPCIIFIIIGSGSAIFMEGSSINWKNTFSGSTAFLDVAFASSSASVFYLYVGLRIL